MEMTTAAALLAYEKELKDGGMGPDTIQTLVIDAGHEMVKDDCLVVKK